MNVKPAVLWASAGVWAVLFGPPGLPGKGLLPSASYEVALVATALESLLISAAVVASVARSFAQPSLTLGSITAATASLVIGAGMVYRETGLRIGYRGEAALIHLASLPIVAFVYLVWRRRVSP